MEVHNGSNELDQRRDCSGWLVGGLALAEIPALAQTPAPSAPQAAHEKGMMMKDMPNDQAAMPINPEMIQEMSKMMDNCNHMMEAKA